MSSVTSPLAALTCASWADFALPESTPSCSLGLPTAPPTAFGALFGNLTFLLGSTEVVEDEAGAGGSDKESDDDTAGIARSCFAEVCAPSEATRAETDAAADGSVALLAAGTRKALELAGFGCTDGPEV